MRDLLESLDRILEEPPRGRQDGPAKSKPAAVAPKPKINPAVPAAGPVRANPINPQAMAATKAAASVVNAPKMAMPTPKPAAPAPRAKVKATAANTKDFDKTMALQKKLIGMGADIKADGLMGPNTKAAMAKFMPKPTTIPKSKPTAQQTGNRGGEFNVAPRNGAAKTKGPDPMGLANPSPETRAKAKDNFADRRAARQQKSREFFRNLGNKLFPKANF